MESETKGREVRCVYCGCAFMPKALTQQERDIEYTFFRCDFCGKAYGATVTDSVLREGIAEYVRMAEENKIERLSEPEQFRMQRLKTENVERARTLRKVYLKEEKPSGEETEGS